jgi:hypothetical protein
MKQLLTAVVFLLISTALVAQSNTATTTQAGDDNGSWQTQTGASNTAATTQSGNENAGQIDQNGNTNGATIEQINNNNVALAAQYDGDNNVASIKQNGPSNSAYLAQGMVEDFYGPGTSSMYAASGSENQSSIEQLGADNHVQAYQAGDNNMGNVKQTGNDNIAYSYQGWTYNGWGEANAFITDNSTVNINQINDDNYSAVWQYGGDGNQAYITQDGPQNVASVAQGFIYDDAAYDFTRPVFNTQNNYTSINQNGFDNVGKLFQLGDNNEFTLIQNGDGNTLGGRGFSGLAAVRNAYFAQDGNGNIFVGTQNDGATLSHESFQFGDDNEIDLIQGEGDVALIQQTGDMNNANVYQYGLTNDASVMQTGNNNTANVTQSN